jgi:cell division protein FtsA
MSREGILAGLDIGSSKVRMLVAELDSGLSPKVIGLGETPAEGIRRGLLVDLEKTIASVEAAVIEAEKSAGVEVNSVLVGIGGNHLQSIDSYGMTPISGPGGRVTIEDIEKVLEAAEAISLPMDREILEVIPQDYTIDHHGGIKEPLGLVGMRLEVNVHVVTGKVNSRQNLVNALDSLGLEVEGFILGPLASGLAVLTPEEQQLGAVLLDIGGETTDIAVYYDEAIRHLAVIDLGGKDITNDLTSGLRIPAKEAESLKIQKGGALGGIMDPEETVSLPSVNGRKPWKVALGVGTSIVEATVERIFDLVRRELRSCEYVDRLPMGVVLTGGSSRLPGIRELAEQILRMPARHGFPRVLDGEGVELSSPELATCVGLVLYGFSGRGREECSGLDRGGFFGRAWGDLKRVFNRHF